MQLYLIIVQHFVEQHFLANETKNVYHRAIIFIDCYT